MSHTGKEKAGKLLFIILNYSHIVHYGVSTQIVTELVFEFTVSTGKAVLIVNGIHRGAKASLVSLDEKTFSVTLELKDVSGNILV